MRNIDSSSWLGNPKLNVIKSTDAKNANTDNTRTFVLQAQQVNKLAQEDSKTNKPGQRTKK